VAKKAKKESEAALRAEKAAEKQRQEERSTEITQKKYIKTTFIPSKRSMKEGLFKEKETHGIDGQVLSYAIAEARNQLLQEEYEILSINPVISGHAAAGTNSALGTGWGYGYGYTSGVIIIASTVNV
jgi:hypothetical protein